jgi:hypothetical protein
MSRILITGMSAPQVSASANKRSLAFAGLLELALTESGHQVSMLLPDITWTKENLEYYDAVLVGVSPLTSLSANYAYGALHIIDVLKDSSKLHFFIDAPNPSQIKSSLTAINSWPQNLTKEFYKNRKGYRKAIEISANLLSVVDTLLHKKWPTTLYPQLPWDKSNWIHAHLPAEAASSVVGVNLDSFIIKKNSSGATDRTARWVADSPDSTWTKKKLSTLNYPAMPMKWHKGWNDTQVEEQIAQSFGALITPHKDNTWWTYRYIQAMNTGTPVSSAWLQTSNIGHSWGFLASAIEDMSPQERYELSRAQTDAYLYNIPNKEEAIVNLQNAIGIREGASHAV